MSEVYIDRLGQFFEEEELSTMFEVHDVVEKALKEQREEHAFDLVEIYSRTIDLIISFGVKDEKELIERIDSIFNKEEIQET